MRWRFLNRAFNTLLFYGGWVLCLKEAAEGNPSYGLLVVFLIIIYHFYRSTFRKADSLMLLLVLLVGPLSDSLYNKLGILEYHNHSEMSMMPPIWIFFLWGLFAVNINLFSWLRKRWVMAILLGAFGGPASYLSAVRLGSAHLTKPLPEAVMVIGGMWAVFLPAFMWINQQLKDKFKG